MSEFELYGTNWEAGGYFECPTVESEHSSLRNLLQDPWASWSAILQLAKRGEFNDVPKLIELYAVKDPVLQSLCFELFGDAAPATAFQPLIEQIKSNINIDLIIYECEALAVRGRLADVPVMMDAYLKNFEYGEASTIPVQIYYILGDVTPTPIDVMSPSEYQDTVVSRIEELATIHGSRDVNLFRGNLLSADTLGQIVISALREPDFNFQYRRRFEAYTGIDCSSFYNEDEELQPLTAISLIEDFLESGEADKYEPGVRYFFGHRIPD